MCRGKEARIPNFPSKVIQSRGQVIDNLNY